ncbi:DUF6717 family protein [Enterococcus faecium]|jgi:hypothetical protein|uniref:DUF6717 family protein n=1 Tax=Enterococcus faecium TaxID=1352 RepID=UPI00164FCFAB|nr:DUF6717 family protein [Enterococcus faecium]
METKNENSLFVIAPYWNSSTWVFDDSARGLVREPFVAGVPAVLTDLVSAIPNAKEGFRLTFSASPFPGAKAEFKKLRTESGGTWYQAPDGREGWLCPALFKYFSAAPERIFVSAEALQ